MNCYEHATLNITVPAVAVCPHCGAALCTEHLHKCEKESFFNNVIGNPRQLAPKREMCCASCAQSQCAS